MIRYVFLAVVTSVWFLAHAYLGRRLVDSWSPPRWARALGWGALIVNASLSLSVLLVRDVASWGTPGYVLQWAAYLGMGAFLLTLSLTVVRDLALALIGLVEKVGERTEGPVSAGHVEGASRLSRRRLLMGASSAGVAAAAAGATGYGVRQARGVPEVKEVVVPVEGLHADLEGFTIVQISDLHVGLTIREDFLRGVVDRVNTLGADIVAITGDLVDGLPDTIAGEIEPLRDLKAREGVYYVTGNHEYYWDALGWIERVSGMGIRALVNAHDVVRRGEARLVVAGVTDYSAERAMPAHRSDPEAALRGAPEGVDFKLLLAHQPKSVYAAADAGFDLQLSGHTHGGQFYPWTFVVGLAHPFIAGLERYAGKMWIYVSRGTGYWGPPIRIGAPPEITRLVLRRA